MKTKVVACGIFRHQIESLPPRVRERVDASYLDSMLHLVPEVLDRELSLVTADDSRPLVILYGDCCPHMREYASGDHRAKAEGSNCIEITLGKERYRSMLKEGAFFLMPEWTVRWKEIFSTGLGLMEKSLARRFIADSATKFVYVDTGERPFPDAELAEIREWFGLPVEIVESGPGVFERTLESALGNARDGFSE